MKEIKNKVNEITSKTILPRAVGEQDSAKLQRFDERAHAFSLYLRPKNPGYQLVDLFTGKAIPVRRVNGRTIFSDLFEVHMHLSDMEAEN